MGVLWSKAKNHDADAAYLLGLKYYNGDEVKMDFIIARQCFEEAKQYGKDPKLPDAYISEIDQKVISNYPSELSTPSGQQLKERLAMDLVVKQYNAATVEAMGSFSNIMQDPIMAGVSSEMGEAIEKYANKLRAIDISDCPEDFRIVFVKYYQAVYELKIYTDSTTGLRGITKGFLKGLEGIFASAKAVIDVPDNTDNAMQSLRKAGNEFELVCTKYGIEFR